MKIRFNTWEDTTFTIPLEDIESIESRDFSSMIVNLKNGEYHYAESTIIFIND